MVLNPILKFFRDIETFNKDQEFIKYRENGLRSAYSLMVAAGVFLLLLFQAGDIYLHNPNAVLVFKIRLITSAFLFATLAASMTTRFDYKRRIFSIAGYYGMSISLAFISAYTLPLGARHWSAPAMLLMVWFGLMPLRFRYLVLHGAVLTLAYLGTVLALSLASINRIVFIESILLMAGFYVMGILLSFYLNQAAAQVFEDRKKARQSDDRYRILTEHMQDVVWTLDLRTMRFSFVSPSVERLRGFTSDEVMRLPFNASFTPESAARIDKMLGSIRSDYTSGKEISSFAIGELEQYCRDGSTVWIEVAATIITDKQGRLTEMLGVSRDITSRRQAEQALRESEEKYRMLINRANDGIFITQQGLFKFVNQAFCDITEYSAAELENMPFSEIIAPEVKDEIMEIHKRRMRGEQVPTKYSTIGISKSGRRVHLEFNSTTIDYEGNPASFVIMRDNTEQVNAGLRIRESEEKYRFLVENANDGIVILQDGKVVFINQMMANILGYTVGEILNTPFVNYIEPSEQPKALGMYQKRQSGEEVSRIYESVLVRKDGSLAPVEFNNGIISFNGRIATQTYIRDIADRKKAEEKLRESETRFREITDLLPQLIYELDNTGRFTFINRTGKEMFGITEARLRAGLRATDLIVERHHERLMRNFRQVQLLNFTEIENEYTGIRSDGSEFPVLVYGSPILRNGLVSGNRGIVVDISDRKTTEEQLRKVNERLTLHFQQTPLAYIEWNDHLEVMDWNPAAERIFGYKRDEVIGRHAFEVIVPEKFQSEIAGVALDILKQEGGQRSTNENLTKTGHTIVCNWYNTPLKDTTGRVIGLASLVQDITEQKMLEAELEKYVTVLEKNYSESKIKVQTYSVELESRKNELLRLQKENLQSQFETLRSQVNPHFLFNSLNVLTSLIKIEPDLAEQFTIQLSMVYRYVLENKEKELVSIETELNFLKAYTFLLDIRFSGKMKVVVDVPDEKLPMKIVPLALQLLIENAIKHNTFSRKNPLVVNVFIEEGFLVVRNNLQVRETHVESTGVGLHNIASRYAFFTETPIDVTQSDDTFTVKIPLLS